MKLDKDPSIIKTHFSRIAKNYDFTNGILSFQMHRLWNRALVRAIPSPTTSLLDLCSGSGEIAYRWLRNQSTPKNIFCLDFCPEMLHIAEEKKASFIKQGHHLQFLQADAALIPLSSSSIDTVTVAYGIRNISNLPSTYKEVQRVLKKGGHFCILELTEPSFFFLKPMHQVYLRYALPWLGKVFGKNEEAYRYLATSIPSFVKPEKVKDQLEKVGLKVKKIKPLMGGIATLLISEKI